MEVEILFIRLFLADKKIVTNSRNMASWNAYTLL